MGSDGRTDAVARELYSLAPGGFVAARDAAAERARADGDRDAAARIRKLHRPTVAAWAVNLLVADAPADIDDLIDLGDLMRAAQREMRGADLRDLSADRSRRVAGLVRRATALAAAAGHPLPTAAERDIATTLEAALADPGAASAVRAGTLTKALTYSGTGFTGGGTSQIITFPTNRTPPKPDADPPAPRVRTPDRAHTPPKPNTDPGTQPSPDPDPQPNAEARPNPQPNAEGRRKAEARRKAAADPKPNADPDAQPAAEARRKAEAHEEAEARRAARRRAVDRAEQAVEAARRARADARAALDTARERREEAIAERHRLRQELARAERAATRADTRLNEATESVARAESALDTARTHLTATRAGRAPESGSGPAD